MGFEVRVDAAGPASRGWPAMLAGGAQLPDNVREFRLSASGRVVHATATRRRQRPCRRISWRPIRASGALKHARNGTHDVVRSPRDHGSVFLAENRVFDASYRIEKGLSTTSVPASVSRSKGSKRMAERQLTRAKWVQLHIRLPAGDESPIRRLKDERTETSISRYEEDMALWPSKHRVRRLSHLACADGRTPDKALMGPWISSSWTDASRLTASISCARCAVSRCGHRSSCSRRRASKRTS
jgi:hypothetical protein